MPIDRAYQRNTPRVKNFQARKQRAVLRCLLVASAEVTELDSGSNARLTARTSEVGLGGCYIDTLNPFTEGTSVRLRILRDTGVFETSAKVVYTDRGCGMGLAFSEMPPSQRSLLESWLAELVFHLRSAS